MKGILKELFVRTTVVESLKLLGLAKEDRLKHALFTGLFKKTYLE